MDPAIAIVGLGGVFPGAPTVDDLWPIVAEGRDQAREVPEGRWPLPPALAFDPEPGRPDRVYSTRGCFVDAFGFDPSGLALPADVAARLDPSLTILLEAGRQAWRSVGDDRIDRTRVGVVLGNIALPTDRASRLAEWVLGRAHQTALFGGARAAPPIETDPPSPWDRCVAGLPAGLLARALELGGEQLCLDAACASSLFALHLACAALRSHRADAMLAGGLSRPDSLYTQMGFSQLRALSARGKCAPFDRRGDGLVVGEGAGVLVLERLEDARARGHRIFGIVRGIGLSNDVEGKLLAPSSEGQLRAMRAAYDAAGWAPGDVDTIECHATGTPVGDAVEIESLGRLRGDVDPCPLGAVKANVGHLLTGAGAVSLVKVLLAMERGEIPPVASFEELAPRLQLRGVRIPTSREPWPDRRDRPRRAAVSGFGFGGTNAHVLVEDERGAGADRSRVVVPHCPAERRTAAVIGTAARVGPWRDAAALVRRIFGRDDGFAPATKRAFGGLAPAPSGWCIDALEVEVGRFKIPPRELPQLLPQQLLVLEAARAALLDAGLGPTLREARAGCFVGIALDLATTDYHLRWIVRAHARRWADALGIADAEAWADAVCDGLGPALDPERVLGGLGSVAASRIARELGIGGPSFSISTEDGAGLAAFQTAVRAIEAGEIDVAVVAAVELGADPRRHVCALPSGDAAIVGEGAVAVILQRADMAHAAHALCVGAGATTSGAVDAERPTADGYAASAREAIADARIDPRAIDLAFVTGPHALQAAAVRATTSIDSASTRAHETNEAPVVARVADRIGDLGAGSGLASVLAACASLRHRVLPDTSPSRAGGRTIAGPQPWVCDRDRGPRAALVGSASPTGDARHVVLVEPDRWTPQRRFVETATEGLFAIEADDRAGLLAGLRALASFVEPSTPIDRLQHDWLRTHERRPDAALAVAIVAPDATALQRLADEACTRLQAGEDPSRFGAGRVFCSASPLRGEVAFVFPGSGSHQPGMGRELALAFADVLWDRDAIDTRLASQIRPALAWNATRAEMDGDVRGLIVAQVAHGTLACDVLRRFGVRPDAVIGYSLGETAGLFALGAWTDRDEMLRRCEASELFTRDLAGSNRAAARAWGVTEPVAWSLGVVEASAEQVDAVLVPRAYRLIVDTPRSCVIGGDPDAVATVVARLQARFHPLPGVSTVHCEVVREVEDAYRELHRLPTAAVPNVRFYSGAWGRAYAVDRETCAAAITDQAIAGVDFPKTIRAAYDDGVRVFVELGPGGSCTRMIETILGGQDFRARSLATPEGRGGLLRMLAMLITERVPVRLDALGDPRRDPDPREAHGCVRIPVGRAAPIVPERRTVAIDRDGCLELAGGSLAKVLGDAYAAVDTFPTRVRLPAEPLMLVDRIVEIDAEPLSMRGGRVVTEHDVHAQRWYLDAGRIPTSIAIEAGQADLFLSGYVGIDLQTRGEAMYRLLDATVVFHASLPRPGSTIRYDIAIERFFRHGDTWMFRFRFDATVDGAPLMSMRDGCAGFFTAAQLRDGKGIVRRAARDVLSADAPPPPPVPACIDTHEPIALTEAALDALRRGDPAAAFGPAFADLPLRHPSTLPTDPHLRLVHRVTALELHGGAHGRGFVRAEADIHPDDWFLACHFVDDPVMPGTLMYECCLHALRIFMLRRGMIGEADSVAFEPVIGVHSRLVCRGQVLPSTRMVGYEVTIREIGLEPEPYAIADAAMFADGKRIVDIQDMALRLSGTNAKELAALWPEPPLVMDKDRIVAFATGRPSEAFGEPYRPFDEHRSIARLPAPPFQLIDRVLEVNSPAFRFASGVEAVAEVDASTFAWTLEANRQRDPAFAVLLEAALQPCGWIAAHIGSALRSDTDLRFRNLGGEAVLHCPIDPRDTVLRTRARATNLSQSGGMIIEHFAFELEGERGPIYSGTTYFGFFSAAALADQVGLRDAPLVTPTPAMRARGKAFPLPRSAPMPDDRFRMIDTIDLLDPEGFVEGSIAVDPTAWFFAAHFHGDPVWPGSLGLQALLQLLQAFALDRWDLGADARFSTFVPGLRHRWTYRGQVTPAAHRVAVQASITRIDDVQRRLHADGLLCVDGRPIYQMRDFGLEVRP